MFDNKYDKTYSYIFIIVLIFTAGVFIYSRSKKMETGKMYSGEIFLHEEDGPLLKVGEQLYSLKFPVLGEQFHAEWKERFLAGKSVRVEVKGVMTQEVKTSKLDYEPTKKEEIIYRVLRVDRYKWIEERQVVLSELFSLKEGEAAYVYYDESDKSQAVHKLKLKITLLEYSLTAAGDEFVLEIANHAPPAATPVKTLPIEIATLSSWKDKSYTIHGTRLLDCLVWLELITKPGFKTSRGQGIFVVHCAV